MDMLLRWRRADRGPIGLLLGVGLRLRAQLLCLLLAVLGSVMLEGAEPPGGALAQAPAPAQPDAWTRLAAAAPVAELSPGAGPPAENLAVSLEPTLYGRNGRSLELGGLTVMQFLDRQMPAARRGELAASYAVYQALSLCAAADEAPHAEQRRLQALCQGVSPAQMQERLYFLRAAARGGLAQAQIDVYVEGPYGRAIDLAQNEADPMVQQWKQDSLDALKAAAGHCEPEALGLLATLFDAGTLWPRDVRQVLSYRIAELHARGGRINEAHLRGAWGETLSDAEFAAASDAGHQLARGACGR